jgi:hypothetical protein
MRLFVLIAATSLAGCISSQTAMTGPSTAHVEVSAGGLLFKDQAQPTFLRKAAELTAAAGKKCFSTTGQKTFDGMVDSVAVTRTTLFSQTQQTVSTPTRALAADIQMSDKCDASTYDAAAILSQAKS